MGKKRRILHSPKFEYLKKVRFNNNKEENQENIEIEELADKTPVAEEKESVTKKKTAKKTTKRAKTTKNKAKTKKQ